MLRKHYLKLHHGKLSQVLDVNISARVLNLETFRQYLKLICMNWVLLLDFAVVSHQTSSGSIMSF